MFNLILRKEIEYNGNYDQHKNKRWQNFAYFLKSQFQGYYCLFFIRFIRNYKREECEKNEPIHLQHFTQIGLVIAILSFSVTNSVRI